MSMVLKSNENEVAHYKTAAATTGGRHPYTRVTAQRVIALTEVDSRTGDVEETKELHVRWRCSGCGDQRGIRAPFLEGDIATRQMKQEARDHADTCRL